MDRYTKVVLTVIAVALSAIALQNARVMPAFAQQAAPVKVTLCDPRNADRCAGMWGDGYTALMVKKF